MRAIKVRYRHEGYYYYLLTFVQDPLAIQSVHVRIQVHKTNRS